MPAVSLVAGAVVAACVSLVLVTAVAVLCGKSKSQPPKQVQRPPPRPNGGQAARPSYQQRPPPNARPYPGQGHPQHPQGVRPSNYPPGQRPPSHGHPGQGQYPSGQGYHGGPYPGQQQWPPGQQHPGQQRPPPNHPRRPSGTGGADPRAGQGQLPPPPAYARNSGMGAAQPPPFIQTERPPSVSQDGAHAYAYGPGYQDALYNRGPSSRNSEGRPTGGAPGYPAQNDSMRHHGAGGRADIDTQPSNVSEMGITDASLASEAQKADIFMRGSSVEDCVALLHEVCDRMGGSIQPQYEIHRASIRPGMHTAICEVTTRFGTHVTAAFFTEGRHKKKQLRMYQRALKDFMPVVSEDRDAGLYRDSNTSVFLPPHILVERCLTLKEAMKEAGTPQERLHELFTICQHITKLLQMQHRRSIVLRDINTRNVVKAQFGNARTWTLLEYCNAARAGTKTDALPASSIPPEMAEARLEAQPVTYSTAFDMWQLGMLVYEVATGEPYWSTSTTDLQILHTLATPSAKLPHEERPVKTELTQRILSQLLTRSENHRLTAEALKKLLDKEEETGTLAATINAGYAKTEQPVVLDV